MITHHPVRFGDHRQCSIGDIMFVVVEGQDSTFAHLDPPLLFIFKAHSMPCKLIKKFST